MIPAGARHGKPWQQIVFWAGANVFLFPCVLLLNIGFIAAQLVIQAQSMQGVIAAVSILQWILIPAIPAAVSGPCHPGIR